MRGLVFGLRDPNRETPPAFVQEQGDAESWFFDPTRPVFSYFEGTGGDAFNEVEFLTKISNHLPPWVYFYVAPNKLRVSATEKWRFPMFLNQGKPLFFVKAVKTKTD